jgi:hypothetical protein
MQDGLARMVRELNLMMSRAIKFLEDEKDTKAKRPSVYQPFPSPANEKKESEKKTALQVINEIVKARLTQEEVDDFDDHGVRGKGTVPSLEYQLLKERGLKVLNVGIGTLRFDPEIEETIINRWSATWLNNAKAESEQIKRKQNIVASAGSEKAIRQYADFLSKDLIQKKPVGVRETLKTLLLRTRALIMTNDQLRQHMDDEQQELEDIIRWIEVSGS